MKNFKIETAKEIVKMIVENNITDEILNNPLNSNKENLVTLCKKEIYNEMKPTKKCLDYMNHKLKQDIMFNIARLYKNC
jgi:hypothetical protein